MNQSYHSYDDALLLAVKKYRDSLNPKKHNVIHSFKNKMLNRHLFLNHSVRILPIAPCMDRPPNKTKLLI